MRRLSATRKALGFAPLVKTGWADAARVERVPFVAAGAKPFVFLAWRPTPARAADAWVGGTLAFLRVEFAIQNN
jgi:hypothetical protein